MYGENVSTSAREKEMKGEIASMDDKKLLGKIGEDLAVALLFAEGYSILDRNFRSHFGEIDIVAERNGVIYFVEVKTRTCDVFGDPGEAVGRVKQQRMRKTAEYYLLVNKLDQSATFKIVEVMIRETDDDMVI